MSNLNITNEEKNDIKDTVIELYLLDDKFKKLKEKYERKKEKLVVKLKNFMFCHKGYENGLSFKGTKSFIGERKIITCKKVTPKKIIWDVDKIEKKIDKEISSQFIDKDVEITDYDGLTKLLKKHGVNPKEFKRFISVNKRVSESKLNQLYVLGIIEEDDLVGCFDVKENSSYLKINVKEETSQNEEAISERQ